MGPSRPDPRTQDPGEVRPGRREQLPCRAREEAGWVPGPDDGVGTATPALHSSFPRPCGGAAVAFSIRCSRCQCHDLRSARAAAPSPRKPGRHPLYPTNPHPRPAPGGGPRPQESGAPGGGWGAWCPPAAFMSLCRRHLSGEACDTLMFLGKGAWPRGSGNSGLMGPLFGTADLKEGLSRHAGGGRGVPGSK